MNKSINNNQLQELYGLSFPETFFQFQEFVDSLPPDLQSELLEFGGMSIGFEGPYKHLKGETDTDVPNPLWQSRAYNDPPEFVTILSGNTDGLHWGYYIDDPNNPRFPVVSFYSSDAFTLSIRGDDIFEAIREEIEGHYETCLEYLEDDPDETSYEVSLERLDALREELKKVSTGDRPETGMEYTDTYEAADWREPVAETRDDMGICVPAHLYRPLSGPDKFQIWNYEPTPEEVEQMSAEAVRLLEDGYPGAALKLGKDLWIYHEYKPTTYSLLDAAYLTLDRPWLQKMLHVARECREFYDRKHPQNA